MLETIALLHALLSIYHPPADIRARLERHEARVVAQATDAADRHHVPVALVLFVAYAESHVGMDHGEGGNWGSPTDSRHRHTAGTADDQARDLETSFRVCHGSWLAAVRRYRGGDCRREAPRGYTAARAIRVVERMHTIAGLSAPEHLR